MPHELLIAIVGGLAGMLGWGYADFLSKKTIDAIGEIASLVWAHICGTLLLGALVLGTSIGGGEIQWPSSVTVWLLILFFGALQAGVYLLLYKGFGKGQVGLLSPVFASYAGVAALVSIIFLNEVVGAGILATLIVIFTGILLLSIDAEAAGRRRIAFMRIPGVFEVGLATVLAALWTVWWDAFVGGRDWLLYAFLMYGAMTVVILIVAYAQGAKLHVPKKGNMRMLLFMIGLGEVIAYTGISYGYSMTSYTSIVALVSGAFALPTIILARLYLNERMTALQLAGSLIIIGGIMLIPIV